MIYLEIKDVKFGRTTRKDFSKVGDYIDSYRANVKASSEGPDRDIIVKFKINEKCIIESYSFEN